LEKFAEELERAVNQNTFTLQPSNWASMDILQIHIKYSNGIESQFNLKTDSLTFEARMANLFSMALYELEDIRKRERTLEESLSDLQQAIKPETSVIQADKAVNKRKLASPATPHFDKLHPHRIRKPPKKGFQIQFPSET
jgi:hypothetical protein